MTNTKDTGKTVLGHKIFRNTGKYADEMPYFLVGPRGAFKALERNANDRELLFVVNAGRHASTWNVKGYQWFIEQNGEVVPHA